VEIVKWARRGRVRLVPEFAHYGNKTWYALFWRYREFFREAIASGEYGHDHEGDDPLPFLRAALNGDPMGTLEEILPDSHLVLSRDSFPCTVQGLEIRGLGDLRDLPPNSRDRLVLKICGANDLAARSYGVLMGHGLTDETWRTWIDERISRRQPFLVQSRVDTAVASLPVMNRKWDRPELFHCRVLLRPWVVGERLVSVSACAVPANTLRVHGRVDMAVVPVVVR
ncbi:MAG: hypothetical protein V1856_02450, partial [Candidatus Liptonbacteria bacterium]